YDRRAAMFWLLVLFVVTLVFLSGWQGLKVAFSMAVSIAMIGYILIPLFLRGANPVPVAIVLSGIFTLFTAGFTTGWNRKAVVTAVGTMGGALVAYLISIVFADWARLSGLSTEEDRSFFQKNPTLNPRGLLFAGIIIAAVGVLEDVAVSISSSVSEVRRHHPRATFKELFVSGMVVGREHMGALANTLIFAYVGASLSSLLLYSQFGGSWLKFINFDSVTDEVIRSLAGTIGLVFTVPITALLAAWAMVGMRGGEVRER
ncbi:YibE/F family protein, partial [Candidatus Uhrbacteria bacterium]|nr:YibE/F family protein [Candidatus Uhrbacteria bacterium]